MDEAGVVEVERGTVRRVLHRYNNLNGRILTLAEVALLEDDDDGCRRALEAIVAAAGELAAFTRATRAELLGDE